MKKGASRSVGTAPRRTPRGCYVCRKIGILEWKVVYSDSTGRKTTRRVHLHCGKILRENLRESIGRVSLVPVAKT